MFSPTSDALTAMKEGAAPIDVSIVMPCLDEAVSLPHCIANAQAALALIAARYGLGGEIVVADNGSTDGSRELAERLGARVVPVVSRGYGAAIIGGCTGAYGRWLLIGDADGSYDFTDGVAMIGRLIDGADLCMGSRFQGGIAPGAMPWKNRYIGNPALTGVLNLFFRTGVDDAHCGLRAISRDGFISLGLCGRGMEFASEMVVKASLRGMMIAVVPARLAVDLRHRPPHLRPWRDGWRHLRFMVMLSPGWTFGLPAGLGYLLTIAIFVRAILQRLLGLPPVIGNEWLVAAAGIGNVAQAATIFALAGHVYGLRQGYRLSGAKTRGLARALSLETMLVTGLVLAGGGALLLAETVLSWTARDFSPAASLLPAVGGTMLLTMGVQAMLGGFLISITAGNDARFFGAAPGATR